MATEDVDAAHCDEINAAAMGELDGSTASAVTLLTGLSAERLDDLGGVPD